MISSFIAPRHCHWQYNYFISMIAVACEQPSCVIVKPLLSTPKINPSLDALRAVYVTRLNTTHHIIKHTERSWNDVYHGSPVPRYYRAQRLPSIICSPIEVPHRFIDFPIYIHTRFYSIYIYIYIYIRTHTTHGKNGTWIIHGDTWIIHGGTRKIYVLEVLNVHMNEIYKKWTSTK